MYSVQIYSHKNQKKIEHPVHRARKLCEVISVITVSQCRTWNAESSPPSLHFSTLAFADRHVLFCFVS